MANQTHVALVNDLYAAFKSGNVDKILSLLSDDVVFEFPKMPKVPLREKYVGKAGVRQFLADRAPALQYNSFEANKFLSDADAVVVLGETAGVVIPTQVQFRYKWVQVFEFAANQRNQRFYEFLDTQVLSGAFAPQ